MKRNLLKLWPVLVVALSILGPQRGSAYYDPQVQRWINRDPLGEAGGVNLYRFAGNQSLYYIDPFGLNLGIPGVSPGHGAMRTPQNIVPGNMIAPPGNTREQMHVALDGVGTLEPTPFADMFNAFLYALQGDWGNAGISAMGMIPYLGDAAKAGKYGSKACSAAREAPKLLGPGTRFGPKIEGQLGQRGWTKDLVQSTIDNPDRTVRWSDTRHLPGGGTLNDPATAYYSRRGGYVVRNDRTGEIIQVSNRSNPNWKAPWD